MPRRVDERDRPPVLLHAVGADVLRDAPLLVRGHVDADDAVQERGLAVVNVAEKGDDGRAGLAAGRIVVLMVQRAKTLSSIATSRWKSTSTPNSTARSSAISGSRLAAMLLIVPMASSFARMVRAGTPIASEKVRMVQGRSTTTLPFRGAAVFAAGAADVRRPPRRGGAGGVFFFAGTAVDAGDPLPLQLPLLASAEGGGPALLFLRDRCGDAGAAARPLAAGRRRLGRETGFRRGNGGRFSRRALLRRVLLRLLLLVLAEVLGKRLAPGPAWRESRPAGA